MLSFLLVTALFVGGAYLLFTVLGGDDAEEVGTGDATSTTASQVIPGLEPVEPGATIEGKTSCPPADGSAERTTTFAEPPPDCIDPAKAYTAEVETSEGAFRIALDPAADEASVNNFVVLSRYHFYDGIAFHRVIPGFVVQGGDPAATGAGDAGYEFTGATPEDGYTTGSVAMANNGGPSTNGSQFFVVVEGGADGLQPNYSPLGKVTKGMEVVDKIAALGSPEGTPTKAVTITTVTITEK